MSQLAASFLRLSRLDVAGARRLLPDMPLLTAFHLQQAGEKLVKAELVLAGLTPPYLHNIGTLVRLLPIGHPHTGPLLELADLTVYAVAARYPGGDELEPSLDPDDLARRADDIESLLDETSRGLPPVSTDG